MKILKSWPKSVANFGCKYYSWSIIVTIMNCIFHKNSESFPFLNSQTQSVVIGQRILEIASWQHCSILWNAFNAAWGNLLHVLLHFLHPNSKTMERPRGLHMSKEGKWGPNFRNWPPRHVLFPYLRQLVNFWNSYLHSKT